MLLFLNRLLRIEYVMSHIKRAVIGVDIGGTKITAHICNQNYETLLEKTVLCPAQDGASTILKTVINVCHDLIQAAKDMTIVGIGIGAAGQIHPDEGIVLDANDNLKGWKGTHIKADIEAALGIPVFVDNDVRTMALAEATSGAGIGYQHLLCITVGTGIGGAIILNGELWHGATHSAGEFGYILYTSDTPIEAVASGPAMEHFYSEKTKSETKLSLFEIVQRARTGDRLALESIAFGATALGKVLAPILLFLNPQAVMAHMLKV